MNFHRTLVHRTLQGSILPTFPSFTLMFCRSKAKKTTKTTKKEKKEKRTRMAYVHTMLLALSS